MVYGGFASYLISRDKSLKVWFSEIKMPFSRNFSCWLHWNFIEMTTFLFQWHNKILVPNVQSWDYQDLKYLQTLGMFDSFDLGAALLPQSCDLAAHSLALPWHIEHISDKSGLFRLRNVSFNLHEHMSYLLVMRLSFESLQHFRW